MKLIPNKKYIIVKQIKKEQTESGIILPEENNNSGEILSIGGKEELYNVGDTVVFTFATKYKDLLIVNKKDVIGYVKTN